MLTVTVKAHAKINLSLDILYRRVDGYYELESIMQSLSLYDLVKVAVDPETEVRTMDPRELIRVAADSPEVPADEENIAFTAAKVMMRRSGYFMPIRIKITKNIPVEAGLAGGSSNAAAVLVGLNHLWNLGLTTCELAEIGQKIGADVPFCIYGGTALVGGIGEKVAPLRRKGPEFGVTLVKPAFGVSTAEVYRSLDLSMAEHPDTLGMMDAVIQGDLEKICSHLGNTLEGVTIPRYHILSEIKDDLLSAGACGVLQTGSGPTVFGLSPTLKKAEEIANKLKDKYPTVLATSFYDRGQEIVE
ncbi:MAG: 4-(cytidine 5'-diphospho)-2-C-methyl-D-erythritol kinase [Firmicutes bacterium]|nr:4-(cytidine 5'-diphospho)-2-C-methyl-D-erythritol kinase [Bacillota bacterium]